MDFKKSAEKITKSASKKRTLAALASIVIVFGMAPALPHGAAFAKTSSISNVKTSSISKFFSKLFRKKAKENKQELITAEEIQKNREKLTEQLDSKIQGKDQLKGQIKDFFDSYSQKRLDLQGDRNYTGKKLPCTCLLVFNGDNDQEKEDAALILGQAIAGDNLVTINADDIKEHEKGKGFYSDYEDAFMHGDIIKEQNNSHGAKDLTNYLKQTQNSTKVIIIKNLDALYDPKGAIGHYGMHPTDEMLRNMVDECWRDKKGKPVDISGLTVICMINETEASLEGRIKACGYDKLAELQLNEDGNVIYDEYGEPVYGTPTPEGNKAIVPHDAAFWIRLTLRLYDFDRD